MLSGIFDPLTAPSRGSPRPSLSSSPDKGHRRTPGLSTLRSMTRAETSPPTHNIVGPRPACARPADQPRRTGGANTYF